MTGLTKKHFKAIAEIIRYTCDNESQRRNLAEKFSNYFKTENPNFNEQKFREAVLK